MLVSKNLLNSECKVSVKMSELDLITFVGILEPWHAFDKSKFNVSFSISVFEILLNLKHLFMLLLFVAMILEYLEYLDLKLH